MPAQTVTYNREKLYEQLWNKPATAVAKLYGISDVGLSKICKRLEVPRPSRGYWTRRAFGKIDPTPPLPVLRTAKGTLEVVLEVVRKRRRLDRERITESLDEGRAAMGAPIVVPDQLDQPHALVVSALDLLDRGKVRDGLVSCRDEPCLDITVSPALLQRAARIMNALILTLEERGFPVEVAGARTGPATHDETSSVTRALVCGEWIRFGLVERLKQQKPVAASRPPRGLKGSELEFWNYWNRPRIELVPSGRLVLVIKEPGVGVRVSWRDRQRRIEARLNDFVKQLFAVAEAKKQAREADTSWRAAFDIEATRKREESERAGVENGRVQTLREAIARWKEARDVRGFVREMRLRPASLRTLADELLDWADAYAERCILSGAD